MLFRSVSVSNGGTVSTSSNYTFTIRETGLSGTWGSTKTVTFSGTPGTTLVGSLIPAAVAAQGLSYVTASWDAASKVLTMTHSLGGAFELAEGDHSPLGGFFDSATTTNLSTAPTNDSFDWIATTWKPLVFESGTSAPSTTPADGTHWYSVTDEVDILYHNGTTWVGYRSEEHTSELQSH